MAVFHGDINTGDVGHGSAQRVPGDGYPVMMMMIYDDDGDVR